MHREVECMYEETQPPADVLDAMAEHQHSLAADAADAALSRADLAALAAPFEAVLRADPAASAVLDRVTRTVAGLPKAPIADFGGRFANLGFRSHGRQVR